MASELKVETSPLGSTDTDAVMLRLKGTVDAQTYASFEQALTDGFSRGAKAIVIDLGDVEYIASVGLGVLISVLSGRPSGFGSIVLMNPRPEVRTVLELLGINYLFRIVSSRAAAVAALSA